MRRRLYGVLGPSVVFAALGFLMGVQDWRLAASFALSRLEGWGPELPLPRSMLWIQGLRSGLHWMEASRFSIPIAVVMLSALGIWLLARTLDPRFGLLLPEAENPGEGAQAHVDVPRSIRAAVASVVTLWLLSAFVNAVVLWEGSPQWDPAYRFFGSIPTWLGRLPTAIESLTHGLILGPALWLLWGPNGYVERRGGPVWRDLLWGVAAGLAGAPALLLLYSGRYLALGLRNVESLADASGWHTLLSWLIIAPALAGAWLGFVAYACRPRPISHGFASWFAPVAAVALAASVFGGMRLHYEQRNSDYVGLTLAKTLQLQPAQSRRKAVLIAPNGRPLLSAPEDGSNDNNGDRIICSSQSVERVENFLRERRYESVHAFRAYVHLFDCAALEWQPDRGLGYSMTMLERAPTPVAAQILKEQLAECAVTPESRAILDQLADERRFLWPEPLGRRWLGAAYLRFGDVGRARQYLLNANLNPRQLRGLLGGMNPLAEGTITGRVRINGQSGKIKVGVVRAETGLSLPGHCRAFEWRHVTASAETDAEGRFTLRGIPEGRYLLVLTGPSIQEKNSTPKDLRPRVITLDRFHAAVDLGDVDLLFREPTPTRPDRGGMQTAEAGPALRGRAAYSSRT